jgi:Cu(I)/Ag(I) efflux system membrane fusion protein
MKKLIYLFAAIIFMTANSACSNSSKSEQAATTGETETTLAVEGSCGMCKTKIEKAVTAIEGVTAAAWDADAKQLTFSYDEAKTSPSVISKAVAAIGYDTELDKASDEAYAALPGCCKYRSENNS